MLDTIKKRRSIRKYKDEMIDKKIIEDIIYHGTLAPSTMNMQPWEFIVLTENKKKKISDILIEKAPDTNYSKPMINTAKIINNAPVLIIVYNELEENNQSTILSVGACIENMLLAATEYNLGSLWIGVTRHCEQEFKDFFNNDKMNLLGCVTIGYTDETLNEKQVIDYNEITKWEGENI